MTFETIRYEVADNVATIILNRPDVLNAVNAQMHVELRAALKSAAGEDKARALIITGEGRGFLRRPGPWRSRPGRRPGRFRRIAR